MADVTTMPPVDLKLPRDLGAPGIARKAVTTLHDVLAAHDAEAVRLIVSELVTNAVRHGDGPWVELRLTVTDGVVRGEVVDDGEPFEPIGELPEDPYTPGRRGLAIVDALTRRWGVEAGSTHVWFELGCTPAR